jgi:hypothetical protein
LKIAKHFFLSLNLRPSVVCIYFSLCPWMKLLMH